MYRCRTRGFTLVECLVVIAIIGILIAMMMPAVMGAREMARRTQCQNNLMQIILAVQQHEAAHECLPAGVDDPGGPIQNVEQGRHLGWLVQLLPFMEQGNAYRQIDFSKGAYDVANEKVRNFHVSNFYCPSVATPPGGKVGKTCYAGNHHDVEAPIAADNNGVFFLRSSVRYDQIADGRSHTIFIGEKLIDDDPLAYTPSGSGFPDTSAEGDDPNVPPNVDSPKPVAPAKPPEADPAELAAPVFVAPVELGWMSGSRGSLRNTGTPINQTGGGFSGRPGRPRPVGANSPLFVGGFESWHVGGAQFAFGDGAVRYLNEQISMTVFQQLGHRSDGQMLNFPAPGSN